MKRIRGISLLFLGVCLLTWLTIPVFGHADNLEAVLRRSSLFGILSIAAAFVIITGGIDLSIGSVVCLAGCGLPWLLLKLEMGVFPALLCILLACICIGLVHGWLIARLRLQPFLVTLCGLLIYRGITRGLMDDRPQGFGSGFQTLKAWTSGGLFAGDGFQLPVASLYLLGCAILAGLFLHRSVWGQYLFAIGRNEEAARFSGVPSQGMTVLAYTISAVLAGLGGVLMVVDNNLAQPSEFGNFYELYAIAGAVLGGCALRGGEGSVLGVLVGAALMQVLRNAINLSDHISQQLEFAVIGLVILCGVIADELFKRAAARRRLQRAAKRP